MPSTLAEFGYVDVIREVFGAGGAHEDIVPTDKQKKTVQYTLPQGLNPARKIQRICYTHPQTFVRISL